MILNVSWKDHILQKINAIKTDIPSPRIAVVGIGNELNGDDAVGCMVADTLIKTFKGVENVLVINGGLSPESYGSTIRRFAPHLVIFIDASLINADPGTIELIDFQGTAEISASTHTFPIRIFSDFLRTETGCETILLGVQPLHSTLLEQLSQPVYKASNQISENLSEILAQ